MSRFSTVSQQAVSVLLIVCLVPSLTGCFTKKLWGDDAIRNFSEPAPKTALHFFKAKDGSDILVQYDEYREKNGETRPRAFYFCANETKLRHQQKPTFIDAKLSSGLATVPIIQAVDKSVPAMDCAVVDTNHPRPQFTIYLNGQAKGPYELPVFEEPSSVARRVTLTPVAVIGDVIVVATFVSGIGFLIWWSSGGGDFGL